MKHTKFLAILSMAVAVSLFAPISAAAKGANLQNPGKGAEARVASQAASAASKAASAAQNAALLEKVQQLNAQIVSLRRQEAALVRKIRGDLEDAKNVSGVYQSQDYQTIVSTLQSLTGSMGRLKNGNCKDAYLKAGKKNGADRTAALNALITSLTAKETVLQNALSTLTGLETKADALAAEIQASDKDYAAFKQQADARQETIAGQNVQIAAAFSDCRGLISNIVATAAANEKILKTQTDKMKPLGATLSATAKSLASVRATGVRDAVKAYKADVKSRNYTDALAQFDKIIGVQQTRITALSQAKSQLQDVLSQLNAIISAGAAAVSPSSAAAA